jgi:C4-dicarboxylate-specific signal transduction histidine kinase
LRFGLAASFVGTAFVLTSALQHLETRRPTLFLFFSAIATSAWIGGRGPGALAVALSVPAGFYFYSASAHSAPFGLDSAVLLVFFTASAAIGGFLSNRQRRARQALEEVQAELARVARVTSLGEMAVSIAHEINQPLAATVLGAGACLRWLEANPPDLAEARAAARHVARDGQRASEVVARIRAMVKKAPPERLPVDINATIREILSLLRSDLSKAGIAVQLELDGHLLPVLGDKIQLQQVLMNLIVNAMEAMSSCPPSRRVLRVASAADHGETVFSIEDSGEGIAPDRGEAFFDAFVTTKPEGLGLGLSICRSIVDMHGGRLWAERAALGGAAFRVALAAWDSADG